MRLLDLALLAVLAALCSPSQCAPVPVTTPVRPLEDKAFWSKLSQDEIEFSFKWEPIRKRAKNVILFLGDGMGVSTSTAARIFKGQQNNMSGEEGYLTYERFPNLALLKTYNVDHQVPDSAATGTAYLTGVKANMGTLGVDANVLWGKCATYEETYNVMSFLVEAAKEGKSVGLVTTTRITHASPAATYAHTPHRDWESDTDQIKHKLSSEERGKCLDIAQQLLTHAFPFKVIFGGGRMKFTPNTVADPVENSQMGDRSDGRDLIEEWKEKHKQENHRAQYLYTGSQLAQLDVDSVDYVLGLFARNHMEYDEERVEKHADEPSIKEMTMAAIQILQKNPKGFVMFVEGGRIDHGHHVNMARNALGDTVAMEAAVESAASVTSEQDTLIMVTADHSHVFTIGTYPSRGRNILGKSDFVDWDGPNLLPVGKDNKPVTILAYANGPSGMINSTRTDLTHVDTTKINYQFPSLAPIPYETHGGEDVAVYARGPWAHLFQRVHEQTMVAQVARFSACLPPYTGGNCRSAAPTPLSRNCNQLLLAVSLLVGCIFRQL